VIRLALRWVRKVLASLVMLIGAGPVSGAVDKTPIIGSPQIDYPGIDLHGPLWAQYVELCAVLAVMAIVGGLLAAAGMIVFSDTRPATPTWRRLRFVWTAWAIPIACLWLLNFAAFGTMGPLYVPQPIIRFALVNGVLSATIITATWAATCVLLERLTRYAGQRFGNAGSKAG
jgi:hypothetical protein